MRLPKSVKLGENFRVYIEKNSTLFLFIKVDDFILTRSASLKKSQKYSEEKNRRFKKL